ncbi:MAG: hypothetical protein U9Q72_01990 [Patescibacteria group bacterium]|nr:hypothetical protein [Patescibacteria group bacterium]
MKEEIMEKGVKVVLGEYLVNNLPETFDEFQEILPGASLKQLKEWRDKIISFNFGIERLRFIEEKIAEIIPGSIETGLILDLDQGIELESKLGRVIETWRFDIFPGILLKEKDIDRLLNWTSKVSSNSDEYLLIEERAEQMLPEALTKNVKLEQSLRWQKADIFQDAEPQEMIKKQIASTLSQILPEPDNAYELIKLRKQYSYSPFYNFIHSQLVNILPESLSHVSNIKKLIKWESEISRSSGIGGDNDEIIALIIAQGIKLIDGVRIYSLPFQPWFLEMAEGEIEIPPFWQLPFFKKAKELVNKSV